MNKENVFEILTSIIFFSFISNITIFTIGMLYILINDELLIRIKAIATAMADLPAFVINIINIGGEAFQTFGLYLDYVWALMMVIFMLTCFYYSYRSRKENYFSFLSILTIGMMILFFILNIILQLNTWFQDNVMIAFANAFTNMPLFTFYMENTGIISLIFIIICLILNQVDFNFHNITSEKDQEIESIGDDEL